MSDELLRKNFDTYLKLQTQGNQKVKWFKDAATLTAIGGLALSMYTCSQTEVDNAKLRIAEARLTAQIDQKKAEVDSLKKKALDEEKVINRLEKFSESLVDNVNDSVSNLSKTIEDSIEATGQLVELKQKRKEETEAFNLEKDKLEKIIRGKNLEADKLDNKIKELDGYNGVLLKVQCGLEGYQDYFKEDVLPADMIRRVIQPIAINANRSMPNWWPTDFNYIVTLMISYPQLLETKIDDRIVDVDYIEIFDENGNKVIFEDNENPRITPNSFIKNKWFSTYTAFSRVTQFKAIVIISSADDSQPPETFTIRYDINDKETLELDPLDRPDGCEDET